MRAGIALEERRLPDAPPVPVGAARVLVVEDDPGLARLLTATLDIDGYAATVTDSALGATALARRLRPNVILLDLALPYRSGASWLAELKADADLRAIPVIIVSAFVDTLPADRPVMAADVIWKPFSPQELLDVLGALTRQDAAC